MNGSTETRTYRGRTLEEVLPQIQAELGPSAVITRRREGVQGGVGGFFGKRMVEVEAHAGAPAAGGTVALPARSVFDAYDSGAPVEAQDLEHPVIRRFIEQSSPFAQELDVAAGRLDDVRAALQLEPEVDEDEGFRAELPVTEVLRKPNDTRTNRQVAPAAADDWLPRHGAAMAPPAEWQAARDRLVELGLPESVVDALARDAERTMLPFQQDASAEELLRKALARHVKIEHGWKTKRRTIALVGAAGAGKTLTAAKLCHAYAMGSPLAVRTLSLENAAAAYRLGTLTEHLDIGLRVAYSPEAAKKAAARMSGESLIVVDTPAVSAGDPEGIRRLAELLAAVKPDEIHLVVPAANDARATAALFEALSAEMTISRILISRVDEVPSAAVAVGSAFTLRKPISYITEGRRQTAGLRPADPAELATLVLP